MKNKIFRYPFMIVVIRDDPSNEKNFYYCKNKDDILNLMIAFDNCGCKSWIEIWKLDDINQYSHSAFDTYLVGQNTGYDIFIKHFN